MTSSARERSPPAEGQAPASPVPREEAPSDRGRAAPVPPDVREIGGPKGPEPTRYGDWEKGGRCSDF